MEINVDYQNTEYTPGDTISGKVKWSPNMVEGEKNKHVVLNLFYYTSGRGAKDIYIVENLSWNKSQLEADFSFVLPEKPYGFSGQLITLQWALELIVSSKSTMLYEFNLSPTGQQIVLEKLKDSNSRLKKRKKARFSR